MTAFLTIKQKRQRYHRLLLALGEARHKEVIVEAQFGVTSTTDLNEQQLDSLIADAQQRLNRLKTPKPNNAPSEAEQKLLRTWRNKCLLVLNERGITATPKDWSPVNNELAKKQYQWILSESQLQKGMVNRKGLWAFKTVDDLKKLFKQLASIRDKQEVRDQKLKDLSVKN